MEPCQVGEREKLFRKVLKRCLNKSKLSFLKNLIHDIRLIEKQVRSIEPDRGSLKILKNILIDEKQTGSIENLEKHLFRKIT